MRTLLRNLRRAGAWARYFFGPTVIEWKEIATSPREAVKELGRQLER
jgi:hypothetical protein